MLLELHVENYAVIDQVTVEFGPGLNLLTGETGAGKSILIDALALLMGEKASLEVVRHGAEKCTISCVFDAKSAQIDRILDENGLESAAEQLIIKREIAANRGRVWVNNQPATVAVLKQLAPELVTIHAQNETVLAFDPPARLKLLDHFAGITLEKLAQKYAAWRELRARIDELEAPDRLRMVDLWSFQKREIDAARLQSGEDSRLEGERKVLMNAEKLYSAAMNAYDLLYESQHSALSSLRAAARQMEELARFEPEKFAANLQILESAKADIEDVSATARDYADGIDASPERLAEVEDRLAAIDKLKRKYGSTVEDVLNFAQDLAQKLAEIEDKEEILQQLRRDLGAAAEDYRAEAQAISRSRAAAARKLEKLAEAEINELAMKAHFQVQVISAENEANWSPVGVDSVAYLIATNAGEPLSPIEKIASGGELSRVMLALKVASEPGATGTGEAAKSAKSHANGSGKQRGTSQKTLVFDEIDAGIGGRAAEAVGKKLKLLGTQNQVLCVTHLPQIASFADHHLLIEKRESGGKTHTTVRQLEEKERTEEIARMLSGAKLTDTSLKHASQMLKTNA